MNMIEIDPKLFITCRLCIYETGTYQIVPSVQEQIKFCFDLDVQPFDGLPQLICKKCEGILRDFCTKKKEFQANYAALLDRVKGHEPKGNIELEPVIKQFDNSEVEEAVTSSQINEKSTEAVNVSTSSKQSKKPRKIYKNKSHKWWTHAGYSKQYHCKLCSKSFQIKSSITNHLKSHVKLIEKFSNVYSKWCKVSIEKFDDKPNKTGSLKTIVWDDNTVLQNVIHQNYYIKFTAKQITTDNTLNNSNSEDEITIRRKTKRRRISSRDSTDTVVLDNNVNKTNELDKDLETTVEEKTQVDTECISIDDSSDNESIESEATVRKEEETQFQAPDYKTIQNIISVCHQKYINKVESQENDTSLKKKKPANIENLLKHKILSIGRKIINKQGFNCNGILRFMEHKNLDIEWKPIKLSQAEKHVRIMTQHKGAKKHCSDTGKWRKMGQLMVEHKDTVKVNHDVTENKSNNPAISNDAELNTTTDIQRDAAVLYFDLDGQNKSNQKKILNQNPVANPKQLPKKMAEIKEKKNNQPTVGMSDDMATLQSESFLPIITSTTSLAQIEIEDGKDKTEANLETDAKPVHIQPRIKVKPASELMAPKTLTSHNSNYPNNLNIPLRVTGTIPQYIIEVHNPSQQIIAQTSHVNNDMIMLHTVELPNCKTDSPFRYFQNLLQIHSMILLDCNAALTMDYKCIIKFKVHYAEGAKDNPIVLCSSLMYLGNTFCIKIRDSKQLEINITKLSANWQWEILKTFRSDVANKMYENAVKFGRDVFVKTNDFIRLLKSIKMEKINY